MRRLNRHLVATLGLTLVATAAVGLPTTAAHAAIPDPTQTNYSLGVLVLKYFPLTANGQNIDISVTGDVGDPVSTIRAKTDSITGNLTNVLALGTAYHRYANASATPSLTFHVVDTKEYDTAVPTVANPHYNGTSDVYRVRPNYNGIMAGQNICDYVQNRGVNEVWIWAYQGPSQVAISESEMSGPNGDISNSYRDNPMPVCAKTYTVYTYNYQRGTAEAVHSHSHQLEAELSYVDSTIFGNLFEGPAHPAGTSVTSRCGSVHNPPNSRSDYDYVNTASQASDCLSWYPDGLGTASQISCANWGCNDLSDTNNSHLNYLVWWMQNFPGKGNQVLINGWHMRNWWDVHANWDSVVTSSRRLTVDFPCTGYGCDNLDPTHSFDANSGGYCSASASTVVSIPADGGTLQMRWGPNCSVNWARFAPNSSGGSYYVWVGRQSPGWNTPGFQFTGTAGVYGYSNQVYAPGPARACVLQWTGSAWGNQVCTGWF